MPISIEMELFAAFITCILLIGVLCSRVEGLDNPYYRWMLLIHTILLILDAGHRYALGKPSWLVLLKFCWITVYLLCQTELILFHFYTMHFIQQYRKQKITIGKYIIVPNFVYMLLWVLSAENSMFYTITDRGEITLSLFHILTQSGSLLVLVVDLVVVWISWKNIGLSNAISLSSFVILPILMIPFNLMANNLVALYLAITIALLIFYIAFNVIESKKLLAQELEVEELQTRIMISQIQPHFLFNSFTSVSYLCRTDPKLAGEACDKLAKYMRLNVNALSMKKPIAFDEELKHTEIYLWLEKLRFEEKLNIEYDIRCKDFEIPALCLQPLVENAVKHGICQKEQGGTVKISTEENADEFVITVKDDGVGFDVNQEENRKANHVGIRNVRSRLEMMCHATLDIESSEGEGTVSTIRIPK